MLAAGGGESDPVHSRRRRRWTVQRVPELVHGGGAGARLDLRAVPSEEPGMAPREIWCNEAQERYVLAIRAEDVARFRAICERERCPFAVVGRATTQPSARGRRSAFRQYAGRHGSGRHVLLGKPPRMTRNVSHVTRDACRHSTRAGRGGKDAAYRVLQVPSVADKTFLVTIGDRTVGGLIARDPMVGPWQVPVADVAVTLMAYRRLRRRGDGDGRALAARAHRCAGVRPDGGRRGDHEHRGCGHHQAR